MQGKFIDHTEFFVTQVRRAEPGSILFQSTFDDDRGPRLIAAVHQGEDGEDEGPSRIYVRLETGDSGFGIGDANLQDVELGATGWRVEVDPSSVRSTGARRPAKGDMVLHQGELFLVIVEGSGRPRWIAMADCTLRSPLRDDPLTVAFRQWRIVKDLRREDEPSVLFDHQAT